MAILLLLAAVIPMGCQSPPPAPPGKSTLMNARNNCYSLLDQLLSQEKDIRILHLIKREAPDFAALIKRIAEASAKGARMLEEFARNDHSIVLDDFDLPEGEAKTRAAISSLKEKNILGRSGDQFQVTMLMDQAEALSYAMGLAKVAAEHDGNPDRAGALRTMSDEMEELHHEVYEMLLARKK